MAPKTFIEWYNTNKGALNQSRRDRYRDDPEYREDVLRRNRASRERTREELHESILVPGKLRALHPAGELPDGTPLFTIGALAAAVGRTVQTVRKWDKNGVIDGTEHRDARGARLYSPDQISAIRAHLVARGLVDGGVSRRPRHRWSVAHVEYADGTTRLTRLYSVGMLAEVLGRSRASVLLLEKSGRLPMSPLRGKGGHRLYTYEMINAASDAHYEVGPVLRGDEAWGQFRACIERVWDANGAVRVVPPNKGETDGCKEGSRDA